MSKLTLLDLAFFVAESEASPKHVAGLIICKRPAKARANFARQMYEEMLTFTDVRSPFNRKIEFSLTAWPQWVEADHVELSDHIFYHKADPKKNSRKDLYDMVSKLHEPMLDRSRPLWEVHVIDGLENGRFALYQKIHHAYADGVTLSRWTSKWLSDSPEDTEFRPIWQLDRTRHADEDRHQLRMEILQQVLGDVKGMSMRFLGMGRLAAMMLLESVRLTKNAIALPFVASGNTPLTGQVTAGRQFTTTKVTMDRVNAICGVTRSSLNHVALTCLDGALHRYLKDQGIELAHPIMIQMPVSLRAEGDDSKGGNKIGIILVELSPPTNDPYIRLRNIGYSLRNVRAMVNSVAPAAIESYTLVMGMMGQLGEMLQLSDRLPPMGNTLVSNVPGPTKHLYVKGAKMEEMHPISTLPPSNLLNITLFSYAGDLYFGLIATDELPNLHRLSDYVLEAFDELESTVSESRIRSK